MFAEKTASEKDALDQLNQMILHGQKTVRVQSQQELEIAQSNLEAKEQKIKFANSQRDDAEEKFEALDGVYTKLKNHFCKAGRFGTKYTSLASAEAACSTNSKCHSVYDTNCNGGGWYLCSNTKAQAAPSRAGSCLYMNGH